MRSRNLGKRSEAKLVLGIEPLDKRRQISCRDIREVPGNPRPLSCAAGSGLARDLGALLRRRDGGDNRMRVDLGSPVPHTMFKIAFDDRQPRRLSCATNGGEVWSSLDAGETWTPQTPPPGGTQVYAPACG